MITYNDTTDVQHLEDFHEMYMENSEHLYLLVIYAIQHKYFLYLEVAKVCRPSGKTLKQTPIRCRF